MASSVILQSVGTEGTAYTIHLAGSGTSYTGSGTPWTSQSTSPYVLSMNGVTGSIWTPTAPPLVDILSGTPPFADGATPVFRGYGNRTETIGIQMYASSYDNAVDLLVRLRLALSPGLTTYAPSITVRYNGATNTIGFSVVSGTVQELPDFVNQEAGASPRILRATMTLVLRPMGYKDAALINNASTMNNSGTSAPTNLRAFGTLTAETIYEGAPLNLIMDTGATSFSRMYLASAIGRVYTTTGAATYTTSSTSGAVSSNVVTDSTAGNYINRYSARCRFLVHASVAATAQFRLEVAFATTSTAPFYTSPWISSTGGVAQLIDCGSVAINALRSSLAFSTANFVVSIRYRSLSGASVSTVVTSWQFLYYYDFCIVNPNYAAGNIGTAIAIDTFADNTGSGTRSPRCYTVSGTDATGVVDMRGTPPRYYAGCSLFAAYLTGTTGLYTVANTMTATVRGLTQYRTLKGSAL